jgi:hypothetical protein
MKRYKVITFVILFAIILFSSCLYSGAQEIDSQLLYKMLEKETILTMLQWDSFDAKILCIVTKHTKKIDNAIIKFERVNFYKKTKNKLYKIHEFEEMGFFGIYPLYDGNLMTIWVGGSAFHINVFTITNKGKITIALKEGTKTMPEIVDIDEDGIFEILLSSGSVFLKDSNKVYPETTRIYKWDGKAYKLMKTITWKSRLDFLNVK